MTPLSGFQKQYLKGLAHHLKPIVQIGKNGLTDQVCADIDRALLTHELIKVKFLEHQEEKKSLTQSISDKLQGYQVGLVGNTAILYRPHPEKEKRKISLPVKAGP